jgi:hypothetical protein
MTISAPNTVHTGSRAAVTGSLRSIDPDCIASQNVTLRVLRPASVADRTAPTSAAGRYRFEVRIKRRTVVRVAYAGTADCEPVRSGRRTITPT